MTLLIVDGFDQYGTDTQNMLDGNWAELRDVDLTETASKVRTGTTAMLLNTSASLVWARRVIPIPGTGFVCSFAHRLTTNLPDDADTQGVLSWRDSDNEIQLQLYIMTSGQLQVTNFDGYEVFSDLPVIVVGAYQSIQMKINVDSSTGSFEVKVDDVTVAFDGVTSNIDTDPTGFGSVAQVQFGSFSGTSNTQQEFTIDDLFILNTSGANNDDFIGDKQAFLILPDGNEVTQDWDVTGAGGVAWQAISEVPQDGDTSYIEAQVVNETSEFTLEDIANTVVDIAGVLMSQVLRKTDAGAAQVQGALISNAQIALGADRPITENYTHWNDIIENDPDGDVPWTAASWNAATYSIEKTV